MNEERTCITQISVVLSLYYKETVNNISKQAQQPEPQLGKPQTSKHRNDIEKTDDEVNAAHVISHPSIPNLLKYRSISKGQ